MLGQRPLAGQGWAVRQLQDGDGKGAHALRELLLPPELAAVAQREGSGCTKPSKCSNSKMQGLSLTPLGTRGNLRAECFSMQQQWEQSKFTAQER